jgi:hypothetical protein
VRRAIETSCTIDIEQTHEHFHAHVALDGDLQIGPGDRVQVHGTPIRVCFGDAIIERREATVLRANWLERAWTKLAARFALSELYEVSFTPRRTL